MTFALRLAMDVDAAAIGAAHVQAWRETYPGIVPASRLATLDPVERAAVWRASIAAGRHVMLAEDDAGLAGFALTAEQREPDLLADHAGEVWSIYLLRRAQRRGIGRALMADAARHLLATGVETMALWVIGDGDAVAFSGTRRAGIAAPLGAAAELRCSTSCLRLEPARCAARGWSELSQKPHALTAFLCHREECSDGAFRRPLRAGRLDRRAAKRRLAMTNEWERSPPGTTPP